MAGKLAPEVVSLILEELMKSGNATPFDKTKQRWLVYWHTLEEWGDIIYNWAQEKGFIGSVCTLFELNQGEDTTDQGMSIKYNFLSEINEFPNYDASKLSIIFLS